jgi:MFS family permease
MLPSVAAATAASLPWLIAARAAQGVCAGTMMAMATALAGDLFPGAAAGRVMGQLAAMSAIGTTLGPAVAGVISQAGPGAIFLVNVPIGLAALVLSIRYLPASTPRADRTVSFDITGAALLAATLAAYALAMTRGRGTWSPLNTALLAAAVTGAVLFVFAQSRTASPLVPVSMFRDRMLSAGLATSSAVATVVMATLIVGPFYLSRGLELAAGTVGLALSSGPASAALTASLAGRVVERLGTTRTALTGLAAMTIGALALAVLPASVGVAGYVLPLVVLASGYATFQTANNTAVMARAGDARRGVVAGLLNLSRNLGLITGASVMGAVFMHATGTSDLASAHPAAVAAGMRITLGVAALLVASAFAITAVTAVGGERRPRSLPTLLRPADPCHSPAAHDARHRRGPAPHSRTCED